MERQYVGVRTVGKTTAILDRIRRAVRECKLTRTIPVVKFERKPRGEFYVFLAVEGTDEMRIPDTVATVLKLAGLTSYPFWPLNPADIKSMVSRAEIETHSLNALTYKSLWYNDAGDPFDLSDVSSPEGDAEEPELGECYDRLLYWVSANAEGAWRTFANACKVLQLVNDTKRARYILRRLILLGHIECSGDGSKWSICPPTLVRSPTDTNGYFLCGQRTPKLLKQLGEHWELQNIPQPRYQGPTCIKVHCEPLDEDVADHLEGNHKPKALVSEANMVLERADVASVKLAGVLPDLEGWKDTLAPIDRLNTANYEIEKWDGKQYAPCDTFYEREGQYVGESGMYRLTRGDGTNAYRVNLYFDQPRQRWLKGDWYGLRFLAHHAAGVDFEVVHDSSTDELLIPADERWPLLYERALILATGLLPGQAENPKWLRYQGVSDELSRVLAGKLNLSVKEVFHE